MSMLKKLGFIGLGAPLVFIGSLVGSQLAVSGVDSWVPAAEARLGRPLTPVSVAGVGRRTVRRCAVGVYNC